MTITNDFFNSSAFEAYKVPAAIHFEYANHDGAIKTLESQDDGINYIAGSAIVTGPKGEQYPISAEKFADLYDDNKDGTATPKKIIKLAKLADHDGVIHTSWGNLSYTANNDFIVKHGDGDFGAVKVDIFNQTYARI